MVLIDGNQLAELTIDHGVGVTIQNSYEVPRVDLDYFVDDEDSGSGSPEHVPDEQLRTSAVRCALHGTRRSRQHATV
jgi:hypothetical protein